MQKFAFLLLLGLFSCKGQTGAQTVIDAAQLESLRKSTPDIQIVDVRTPPECQATGIIEGARRIDFSSPDFAQKIGSLDKSKPVIVYCAAGGRSPRAAALMVKNGFKTVYDYAGGMNDWKSKGKKTVN